MFEFRLARLARTCLIVQAKQGSYALIIIRLQLLLESDLELPLVSLESPCFIKQATMRQLMVLLFWTLTIVKAFVPGQLHYSSSNIQQCTSSPKSTLMESPYDLSMIVHRTAVSSKPRFAASQSQWHCGQRSATELHSKHNSSDNSSSEGERVRKRDRVKRFLTKAVPTFFKRLRNGGIDGSGDANAAGGLHDDKSIVSGDAVFGVSKTSEGTKSSTPRYRTRTCLHYCCLY
jgi:hypothetical protein